MFIRLPITHAVQNIVSGWIAPGDVVLDATVGKGLDTLFLARAVGNTGQVIGFDIQKTALQTARSLLEQENIQTKVQLIHASHSDLKHHNLPSIKAAMFNLGYLPGGAKHIITCGETTIQALASAIELLLPGGGISIVSYYAHPGGREEKERLEQYLAELPAELLVTQIQMVNRSHFPPAVFIIEK